MSNDKIERIRALSDEVRDFHPVLNSLLRKLPGIISVEYRQGPREMGADFVVERQDSTLLSMEYAGVIVKVGKVLQNHGEIERQIEECELERTYAGGKKKIFLSEVWVVSNDSISQGAQDKINHKYKNKSIKFISGEKVVELLDRCYPEYWTDMSVEVGEYFRLLESKASLLASGASMLGAGQNAAYIDQMLIPAQSSKDYRSGKKAQKKKCNFSAATKSSRLVLIESSMGAGKSTLLAVNALNMAKPENFNTTLLVPILATVKEITERYDGRVSNLVSEVKEKIKIEGGRYLVMLDGLDELNLVSDKRVGLVASFREDIIASDDTSLVITTRPLSLDAEGDLEKGFDKFSLLPFSVSQVIRLVDSLCNSEAIRARLTKDLEKSDLFKVLPKTPISAILLAKLLQENVNEIPSTMTELYNKYMELVMGRWDMNKGLQSQTEYEVLFNVAIDLATFMIQNSLDAVSVSEARDMFRDYVGSRNLKIESDSTFDKLLSRDEVFAVSVEHGVMSFRHRTFAEFFYACGLGRSESIKLTSDMFSPYWSTVYFFYYGLRKDAASLVQEASRLTLDGVTERFNKLVAMPSMLLASYLTPYDVVIGAVRKYFNEAATLYVETVSAKEKDSPLLAFSEVDLLCICTRIVSSRHAYEFFERALLDCAEDIYSRPGANDDVDMVELFFINSALASIGYKKSYGTFIDNYGPRVPLALQLGVVEHSEEVGLKTDAVERYGKRLYKSIKTNPALARSLKSIMDHPISGDLKNGRRRLANS